MMGGAADHLGNITPVAEFNVWSTRKPRWCSPPVCRSRWWAWTSRKHAVFTPEESAKLRGMGTPSRVLRRHPEGRPQRMGRGFELADPIAMAVALDPEVATRVERRFVAVETGGEWCRGQTVVYRHEIAGMGEHEPNVEVVEEASRERFLEMLYEAVPS